MKGKHKNVSVYKNKPLFAMDALQKSSRYQRFSTELSYAGKLT